MRLRFGLATTWLSEKYTSKDDLRKQLALWTKTWSEVPQPEWVHIFIHTLDIILTSWYLEIDM